MLPTGSELLQRSHDPSHSSALRLSEGGSASLTRSVLAGSVSPDLMLDVKSGQ